MKVTDLRRALLDAGEDTAGRKSVLVERLSRVLSERARGTSQTVKQEVVSSMRVVDLKAELKRLGLPVTGRKFQLVDRLRAHRSSSVARPIGSRALGKRMRSP